MIGTCTITQWGWNRPLKLSAINGGLLSKTSLYKNKSWKSYTKNVCFFIVKKYVWKELVSVNKMFIMYLTITNTAVIIIMKCCWNGVELKKSSK